MVVTCKRYIRCLCKGVFKCVQVGAQTETELKEKKLRVEDALNATKVNVVSY